MNSDKTVTPSTQRFNAFFYDLLGTAIALLTLALPFYSTALYSSQTAFVSPALIATSEVLRR